MDAVEREARPLFERTTKDLLYRGLDLVAAAKTAERTGAPLGVEREPAGQEAHHVAHVVAINLEERRLVAAAKAVEEIAALGKDHLRVRLRKTNIESITAKRS